ncbi:MAG: hypothetical protein R3E79_53465 [Caldilineaceae bacterium]
MYTTFQHRSHSLPSSWALIMAPGIFLTLMALAILIWPELLAYMVAGVLLFVGLSVMGWAWSLRKAERRATRNTYIQYSIR